MSIKGELKWEISIKDKEELKVWKKYLFCESRPPLEK